MIKAIYAVLNTLLLTLAVISTYASEPELIFKDNDRIVFIGNSITHDGRYHMFLQMYLATRYPDIKIEYYNCGVAGDVADGMINRFEADIMVHKPTHAFLMTGMNDVARYLYTEENPDTETLSKRVKANENYFVKTNKLVNMLTQNKVSPIFLSPSPYDETAELEQVSDYGTNEGLALYANHIRYMAKEHNAPCIDFHQVMTQLNADIQCDDPSKTIIGKDRIHPGTTGHFVMANEIITNLVKPNNVSSIHVDARQKRILLSDNCQLKMDMDQDELSFNVLAKALPFAVNEDISEALELVPFQSLYNKELLKISGLSPGRYSLLIDNEVIACYDASQMADGVNLSENKSTPQYKQAIEVTDICKEYHKLMGQLRSISFIKYKMLQNYEGDGTQASIREYLDAHVESQKGKSWYGYNKKCVADYYLNLPLEDKLWEQLEALRNQIYTSNKPQWHNYKLVK